MSAYVEPEEHIREIAAFAASRDKFRQPTVDPRYIPGLSDAVRAELITVEDDQATLATCYANILYRENLRSVSYRYGNSDTLESLPGREEKPLAIKVTLDHIMHRHVTNPVHILKMCNGLEYQSCETENYRQTDAYALVMAIKEAAIRELPGYDDAPWSYEEG